MYVMKRLCLVIGLLLTMSAAGYSQTVDRSQYREIWMTYEGDSAALIPLMPVHIYPVLKFKNNKERQEYSKLVRDVRIAYPYSKMISYSIIETYEYMQTMSTDKEREKYMKDVQKYMMDEYKPKMKKMTKNQGKILVKLVDRECNTSSYNIVKALVGSFKAGVYNAFAGLFGNSLKAQYDPDGKDSMIEEIVLQIEEGTIDINYARNYHSFRP